MLTRILAACVGLPLLLAVVLFLPPVATAILFALACGVAAYEMLWRTGILKHRRILVYPIVAAMANVMWSWLRACSIVSEQTLWLCALLGLFVYFCALFCELLAAHTELRFAAVCVALFSGFVYPFLIGALVRLRGMDGGKFYILVAFLLSMVADSGAYFVGRACGKHKLAPIVSPKKTVEGAVGGDVCARQLWGDLSGTVGGDFEGLLDGNLSGCVGGDFTGTVLGNLTGNVGGNFCGVLDGDLDGAIGGDFSGKILGRLSGAIGGDLEGDVDGDVVGTVGGNIQGNINGDIAEGADIGGDIRGDVMGDVRGHVGGTIYGKVYGVVV